MLHIPRPVTKNSLIHLQLRSVFTQEIKWLSSIHPLKVVHVGEFIFMAIPSSLSALRSSWTIISSGFQDLIATLLVDFWFLAIELRRCIFDSFIIYDHLDKIATFLFK